MGRPPTEAKQQSLIPIEVDFFQDKIVQGVGCGEKFTVVVTVDKVDAKGQQEEHISQGIRRKIIRRSEFKRE